MNDPNLNHVVFQLFRVTQVANQWGLAGRLVRTYGYETCMKAIQSMQEGFTLNYVIGAIKNEARKNFNPVVTMDFGKF